MLNIERLSNMNHWWKLSNVKQEFIYSLKRNLFKDILNHLEIRQIIGIVGLRRVGKTTLFYEVIDYLIKKNINPKNIIYFSFDEIDAKLEDLFKVYEEDIIKKKIGEEKIFVFLDEIQKLEDWQNKVKIYYDLYPNKIKFFISGSASLNILLKAKESLAGRIFYFYLDLLSFHEFLMLREKDITKMVKNPELWKKEIKIELNNYILKPFPEIINSSEEISSKYIKESVIEKIIFKDLTGLFEIKEIEVLGKIINIIASNPGLIINLDDLSKDINVSRQLISNYLYYLQTCFLIREIKNFRGSLKASSRKLKKYYLLHPCFALALNSAEIGKIMENIVMFDTKAVNYWREKEKEVDFILKNNKEILPLEVKYKNNVRIKELKGLLKFMEKFRIINAIVITEDYKKEEKIENKNIKFIPLWKWLLKSR